MVKKIRKTTDAEPMGSTINPPSSKHTCLLFAGIALIILALFFIGVVISGIVLWKVYGPQFMDTVKKSISSSISKEIQDEMPTSISESPNVQVTGIQNPPVERIQPTGVDQQQSGMEGEIIPESNIRNVTRADLVGLTPWELKVARNEIYARHGRPFVHKDLSCYFANTSWYRKDPGYTDSRLSSLEINNATFILSYEKQTGSPIWNTDTGCR